MQLIRILLRLILVDDPSQMVSILSSLITVLAAAIFYSATSIIISQAQPTNLTFSKLVDLF